ncbi:MAG: DNA-directed RNA polymerase subunit E'' [Candidatus Aenigmarchaeota archaeon]|nr:DNA-directed RNA polymerase subunit E'' [Candidatus Aenigmarchaeota archaeon]
MARRACRKCKRIVEGSVCPVCQTSELTSSFQGAVMIFDVNSEIAKKLGISAPGTYAIRV